MRSLLALLCLALPATAQSFQDENILMALPEGFVQAYAAEDAGTLIVEYIPEGETLEGWTRMVALQMMPPGPPLVAFHRFYSELIARECPGGGVTEMNSAVVRGYETGMFASECPASPLDGELEFNVVRVLMGRDKTYIARHVWSGEGPSPAALDRSVAMLAEVTLCDTRTDDAPCPEG